MCYYTSCRTPLWIPVCREWGGIPGLGISRRINRVPSALHLIPSGTSRGCRSSASPWAIRAASGAGTADGEGPRQCVCAGAVGPWPVPSPWALAAHRGLKPSWAHAPPARHSTVQVPNLGVTQQLCTPGQFFTAFGALWRINLRWKVGGSASGTSASSTWHYCCLCTMGSELE